MSMDFYTANRKLESKLEPKVYGKALRMLESYSILFSGFKNSYADNHSIKLRGRMLQLLHESNLERSYHMLDHDMRSIFVFALRYKYKGVLKAIKELKEQYKESHRMNAKYANKKVRAVFNGGTPREVVDYVIFFGLREVFFRSEKQRYWNGPFYKRLVRIEVLE